MKCLNRNVLIGLGVFALAMFIVAPGARGALPLLFLLACPLMMVWMMSGMSKNKSSSGTHATNHTDPQQEIEAKNAEIARLEAMLHNNQTDRN